MRSLLPDLTIYTVKTREYDTETKKAGGEVETVDIFAPAPLKAQTAVDISQLNTSGYFVEVYQVKSATVKYVDGEIALEDVKLPKSPVWSRYNEIVVPVAPLPVDSDDNKEPLSD